MTIAIRQILLFSPQNRVEIFSVPFFGRLPLGIGTSDLTHSRKEKTMKKTIAFVAMTMVALSVTNTTFAQKMKTRTVQQQQTYVQPGFGGQQQAYVQPTPKLGFTGQMVYGYGMKVLSVNWGSAAQRAGLEAGDVITRINGRNIRSQWDYDQALISAANYNYGQVNMKVRNVRYDWGHNVPRYAFVTTTLNGFSPVVPASPVGPIGPRAQQYGQYNSNIGPKVATHKHP